MFYVYILKNENGSLYTGQTNNLDDRILRHNQNRNPYTKRKGPWKLVFQKSFSSRSEVMAFEKWLKTGVGRDWIKINIG